jgi:hypothetical protein
MYKWIRTSALAALLFASAGVMAAAPAAPAAADLVGIWQGKLAVDPKNSLTIQFTFAKDAKGAYTAVLNSPDNGGIKNTPATGVTFDGSNVKLQVAALSGSYAGTLKDGKINGQWTQPGGALPLVPGWRDDIRHALQDRCQGRIRGNACRAGARRRRTADVRHPVRR